MVSLEKKNYIQNDNTASLDSDTSISIIITTITRQ